jgi:hypothetical protein
MTAEVAVVEVETPSQDEAMTSTKNVKLEMGSKASQLANALAIIIAAVIALCVGTVLADGTSVIKLKPVSQLPIATNPALKSEGVHYRLDELLGPTYGIGLHHDQAGYTWTQTGAQGTLRDILHELGTPVVAAAVPSVIATDGLKHPVPFLMCEELKMAGLAAMSLGFIAEIVAVLMVIFHVLALAGMLPAKIVKPAAGLIWLTLTAGFAIVILLAIGIYRATWTCQNAVVPSIKIYEHFDYNYGFYFAIVGFLSSLLVFTVMMVCTTMSGAAAAPTKVPVKVGGGVAVGIVLCAIASIIVFAANGGFAPPPAADPNVNPCEGQKPYHAGPSDKYFSNTDCVKDSITQTLEQAGANVTKGYKGGLDAQSRVPITVPYSQTDLCPVNVHWHLGAEHLSVGEFDEHGKGPGALNEMRTLHRQLGEAPMRQGFQCHHYKANDAKFTTPYNWKYCKKMEVGQTYEIHWPHSAAGACGTKWQYQTPFYDGVFCNDGIISIAPLNTFKKIGVQSQTFTVVNDEAYYNGDLFKGMLVDDVRGKDIAMYTGSTTGTSRDNNVCSRYTPITWQVDRKCTMISASSFDQLCKDMKENADSMSGDLYPHGARTVVAHHLTANNQQSRK